MPDSTPAATALQDVMPPNEAPLLFFGHDPVWLMLVKTLLIFVVLVVTVLLTIWAERRVVGRMQQRLGPNRVGPFGVVQGLMDGVKLALKEEIFPTAADKFIYIVAPILSAVPAFLAWAVIPFGPVVSIGGHETPLQLTDFPVAVLYVLAAASIGIYGIVLAGWASGSTYPLLGGLRSTAQMISYEIAMGLSFVGVFLLAGSMSTSSIVYGQTKVWFVLMLLPSFVIYVISMVGETNRAPFDLAEAESELVGGFHTEYSTLKFAMFFLAEYINMVTVAAVATTLFLGGWRAPWPISIWSGANEGWWPILWFFAKVICFLFMFIWLRGTLPRYRYDQFMHFGWKVLIPVAIGWVIILAVIRGVGIEYDLGYTNWIMGGVGLLLGIIVIMVLSKLGSNRTAKQQTDHDIPTDFDAFAGGYPVPPLPGQTFESPRKPVLTGQKLSSQTMSGETDLDRGEKMSSDDSLGEEQGA